MMSETDDVDQLVDNDELDNASGLRTCSRPNQGGGANRTGLEYVNPSIDFQSTGATDAPKTYNQTEHADLANIQPVDVKSAVTNGIANGNTETSPPGSHPVYYSNRNEGSTIIQVPVVVTRSDGTRVIQTNHNAPQRWRGNERPLRQRRIKLLKAFSVVAIVLFFPLGIPALYFAFKTEKEFEAGIMRCDLDLARKLAKRTERLIIFSFLASLLVTVIVFSLVERTVMAGNEDYWRNRSQNHVITTG